MIIMHEVKQLGVMWYNEKLSYHREEGPAIIFYNDGLKEYWRNGEIFYVKKADGTMIKEWS